MQDALVKETNAGPSHRVVALMSIYGPLSMLPHTSVFFLYPRAHDTSATTGSNKSLSQADIARVFDLILRVEVKTS